MKKKTWFLFVSLLLLTTACGGKKKTETETTMTQAADVSKSEENEKDGEEARETTEERKEETSAAEPIAPAPVPSTSPTTQPSPTQAVTPAPPAAYPAASQAEKIQHIRDVYGRTIQNQDNYQQSGGKYYMADGTLVKAVTSNGNPVLDQAMSKNGYSTYGVEYYYEDYPGGDDYPIFIYAIIDKKEYRYYFYYGQFIRRVGPEGGGNTNDTPEMNSFIQTLRDEGASYRGETFAPAPAQPTAPPSSQVLSHAEKIAYIQKIYERTEQELSVYRNGGRHYYSDNCAQRITVSTGGNYTLDEAMKKNGYSTYTLTYYYDHQGHSEYYTGNPVLVHGIIDGKEYWYYFYDGEFIRRVGPEGGGNTNDSPTSNSFIETIIDESDSLRVVCSA